MTSILSNAIAGITNSQNRVNKAAENIAVSGTDAGKNVSFQDELIKAQSVKGDLKSNIDVIEANKKLQKSLIDILS